MMPEVYKKAICKTQDRLFRYASNHNYNMEEFTECFMTTSITNEDMDGIYSPFNTAWAEDILEDMGYPTFSYGKSNPDVAGWIGYIYRRLQVDTGIKSKDIYTAYPYKTMELMWIGGHTMDDSLVVEDMAKTLQVPILESEQEEYPL